MGLKISVFHLTLYLETKISIKDQLQSWNRPIFIIFYDVGFEGENITYSSFS